jgi:IS4 transposase
MPCHLLRVPRLLRLRVVQRERWRVLGMRSDAAAAEEGFAGTASSTTNQAFADRERDAQRETQRHREKEKQTERDRESDRERERQRDTARDTRLKEGTPPDTVRRKLQQHSA